MSEDNEADTSCCASCRIAKVDGIKLMECDDCDLVRYCSDECKKEHKLQHEDDCKKRVVELRDELLFKQPESSHRGDCPICMIPLQLEPKKAIEYHCCSETICNGCTRANMFQEVERRLENKCPFCRASPSKIDEVDKRRMKRIEANDPVAMRREGLEQLDKGDYSSAFRYFTKAAELGDMDAHYQLAGMYHFGHGVEKDEKKEIHHTEVAAIGGHPDARCNLASYEARNGGDMKRAVRHLIIAATQGHDGLIKTLMDAYKGGF
eukprot:scaffold2253_cov132-Skeletonema_marinoi.AAC.2